MGTRFHQVVPLLRNRNAPNKISVLSRCSTPRGCPGCQGCSGLSPGLSPGTPADMRYAGSSSDTIGFSPFKYLLILLGFSFGILFWDFSFDLFNRFSDIFLRHSWNFCDSCEVISGLPVNLSSSSQGFLGFLSQGSWLFYPP